MRFGFQRLDRGCCVGNGGLHDGWGWMWLGRHVLRSRSSLNNIVRAPETCQRMESVSWKVGCVKIRPHMSIPAPAIAPPYFIARYNCLDTGTTLIIIIAATDFESSFFFGTSIHKPLFHLPCYQPSKWAGTAAVVGISMLDWATKVRSV